MLTRSDGDMSTLADGHAAGGGGTGQDDGVSPGGEDPRVELLG